MILFINPLLPEIQISIFGKDFFDQKTLEKNLDVAAHFPKLLVNLVDTYNIDEIWCISGPGPFTLMRIIVLSINALTLTRDIRIKSAHFFDIIPSGKIPIIEANPRECIIGSHGENIMMGWDHLPKGSYEGIVSTKKFTEQEDFVQYQQNKADIIRVFSEKPTVGKVVPIYFKSPNITCSTTNT